MEHTGPLWAALRDTLNLTGIGALITGLFLISKGKSDQRVLMEQLKQKTAADARLGDQADVKFVSEQRTAAALEAASLAARIASDRDYWEKRCREREAEMDMRNKTLADFGTNYLEMFALMAIPGAMATLRSLRDKQPQT